MKFTFALLAAAQAAEFSICTYTQKYYASDDDDCSGDAAGDVDLVVLVDVCSYDSSAEAWFKVTSCSATAVSMEWFDSAACSDTPEDDQKTEYTAIDTCTATDKASTAMMGSISALSGAADGAALCGFKAANHSNADCATAADADPTFPLSGIPDDGLTVIVDECYFMSSAKFFKVTACSAADVWTMKYFTAAGCASGDAVSTAAELACTADTCSDGSGCLNAYFDNSDSLSIKISDVVHDNTVAADDEEEEAAATITAGYQAFAAMMYL